MWESSLPDMEAGRAKVERFTIDDDTLQLRDYVPPGTYRRLRVGGALVMSDTPDEYWDHLDLFSAVRHIEGDVLLNGFGLGCAASVLAEIPNVGKITAVEIEPDVIGLMRPHFPDVEFIEADAMEWRPERGRRFGCVWHDIWPSKCSDNLDEMKVLHRAYGRRCEWQGSWARAACEYAKRQSFGY